MITKIAFLSNYTIDLIINNFKNLAEKSRISIKTYYPGFNQISNEIRNQNSGLYQFEPDMIFISFDVNPLIFDSINSDDDAKKFDRLFTEFFDMLKELNNKLSHSIILIENFYLDPVLNSGTLEYNYRNSLENLLLQKNLELVNFKEQNPNFKIVDINSLLKYYGASELFDYKYYYLAKYRWSSKGVKHLSNLYLNHLKAYLGIRKKCIVLDLDNTLWGGIIGQDGLENLILSNDGLGKSYYDFQKLLLMLYSRGIILAICSKNSENVVDEVFEKHPYMLIKKSHLASLKINWNNKFENIKDIANELNIGLDSIVFLDDSEFERNLIRQQLPEVEVPDLPKDPTLYPHFLSQLEFFNFHQLTSEDFQRNKTYLENLQRKEYQKSFKTFEDYLKSLNMVVKIDEINNFTFPRILQLIQKTNQFNTTTKRYTESVLKQMMNDSNYKIYSFSVEDKFGDNGIVGVVILKLDFEETKMVIDSFIMSCRVIGRNIESAIIYFILNKAKSLKFNSIEAEIIPTEKNEPCRDVYKKNHFTETQKNQWLFNVNENVLNLPDYFILKTD